MTKEQREAIKSLNEFANTKYGAFTAKEGQTVLSMLKEQQEENKKKEELGKKVQFDFWEKYDENHTVIRFATSWGTKMEDIDALIELL